MAIRQALESDCDRIVELEKYAFGYPTTFSEQYKERFKTTHDQYVVFEADGNIVASGRVIPFEQNIRGCWKRMGGLGSLATAPETRRQGVGRYLMDYGISLMHSKGFDSSALYPFKDTFYSAIGYINCPPILSITADPVQLKRWTRPLGYSVERMKFEEGKKHFQKVHEKHGERTHGAVRRLGQRWEELSAGCLPETVIVFGPSGEPEGVMTYQNTGYSQFGDSKTIGTMSVKEWYWLSCEARCALLNFIFLHSDQIKKVSIPIDPVCDDYFHWVEDRNIPIIQARRSYMVRCVNVQSTLTGIPVNEEGDVTIEVVDPYCELNNNVLRISTQENHLFAEIVDSTADMKITIEGITALIYGIADGSTLRCLSWLEGPMPDVFSKWFDRRDMWMTEDF